MKKIEYQSGKCDSHGFQNILNVCANDGWELVSFSVIHPKGYQFPTTFYVFKKDVVYQPYD